MTTWKKSLIAICVMQFFAMAGMTQFLPFLPLYIQSLGVQQMDLAVSWSGIIFGVGFLMAGLMAPVWGNLADRWGRKRVVVKAVAGSSLALFCMAFAGNVWQLLGLRILHGLLGGFVSSTTALVTTMAPENKIGSSLGAVQSSLMAGLIVGPLMGGVMLDYGGFRSLIILSAIFLLLGLGLFIFFVPDDHSLLPSRKKFSIAENIDFVKKTNILLSAARIQFLVQVSLMAIHPVLVILIREILPGGAPVGRLSGLVFGLTAFATLLGAAFWGRIGEDKGSVRVLKICLLGAVICYVPQMFFLPFTFLLGWRIVFGGFLGGIQPSLHSLIAHGTPTERRAGVLGVTFALSLFGNALGPVLGGFLGSHMGIRAPFVFSTAVLFMAWVLSWRVKSIPKGGAPLAEGTII